MPVTAEIVTIIGTGIALAVAILPGIHALRRDVGSLRERMARVEGILEGLAVRSDSPLN
ncbi:MAG: hypothetical protein OXJ54_12540 [Gemmatimonadetes bacterium]|nr:hypothetical protein [Candidatus Palauibacter rhopaloidicola]